MVRFIYDRCALVLVQSRGFVPAVLRHLGHPDAAKRIRYFASWSEPVATGRAAEPAPEVAWRPDLFTVVFTGNVGEAQDFPAILEAAERLRGEPRVRWVIVGDGRATRWVEEEVRKRGLAEQVLLVGRFPLERMPSFLRHADALLVSLRADPIFALTIPAKVQSYLQSGVPIVAMLDGEGARVVEESGAGLTCSAGNSEGLARAVLSLLALSPAQRTAMGQRGADYASREFSREQLISRLEALLVETVSAAQGASATAQVPAHEPGNESGRRRT
jgi:glycosyltransferase involved in cell wall biosynthesis